MTETERPNTGWLLSVREFEYAKFDIAKETIARVIREYERDYNRRATVVHIRALARMPEAPPSSPSVLPADFKLLASAMRKVLPPALLAEVLAHLDPLTPFVEFLRTCEPAAPAPAPSAMERARLEVEKHARALLAGWEQDMQFSGFNEIMESLETACAELDALLTPPAPGQEPSR